MTRNSINKFDVVPLCEAQLMDVNPLDILNNGLYRKCNTYKGGGGYDKFPEIYNARFGTSRTDLNNQFVVQVQGCPLACPYCYVTKSGIHGNAVKVTSEQLVKDYKDSGCSVFHLMGGAPALHIKKWPDLLSHLGGEVFHSDFLCLEGEYDTSVLSELAQYKNSLYSISIKGGTPEEFEKNTATKFNEELFSANLDKLFDAGLSCYFTFTGMTSQSIEEFKRKYPMYPYNDSFAISLVHYNALDYNK